MRESEIEKRVCQYAESKGTLCYKFVSPGRRGVPDRMCIDRNGRAFFIEFKQPGGSLRPEQMREIERMNRNRAIVYVIDNIEDAKVLIDAIIN